MCVRALARVCACECADARARVCVRVSARMCVCVCVCVCMCACACVRVYVFIRTRPLPTHTGTKPSLLFQPYTGSKLVLSLQSTLKGASSQVRSCSAVEKHDQEAVSAACTRRVSIYTATEPLPASLLALTILAQVRAPSRSVSRCLA